MSTKPRRIFRRYSEAGRRLESVIKKGWEYIMQNGDNFWLIDMATTEGSALYEKSVLPKLRNPSQEDWLLGRP